MTSADPLLPAERAALLARPRPNRALPIFPTDEDSGVDSGEPVSGFDGGPVAAYGPAMIDSGSEFDAAGVVLYGPGVIGHID